MGRARGSLGFVGVTASASSINKVFPVWARYLGLEDAKLVPFDLPLDTQPTTYRRTVARIRDEQELRGALVTSHKVKVLAAARDLFDGLDPFAERIGEVSCISKRDGQLLGYAKDPITAGRALEAFVPAGHFAGEAEVLCFGAGGSGLAIALRLGQLEDDDRPALITLVDRDRERLEDCRTVLDHTGGAPIEFVVADDAHTNDRLLSKRPPGSLVVNATGLGKDQPGSPIGAAASFPPRALVWELNYRGELAFLRHAQRQAEVSKLTVEDGWTYFVHGWSEVIAEVYDLELAADDITRLSDLAAGERT
jgi:shikimate dehydrogenase